MGLSHDGASFDYEFQPATKDYDGKVLVREGTMAGLRLRASTDLGNTPVATIEVRFLLGEEYVDPSWLAQGPRLGWIDVDIAGTPGSRLTHELVDMVGFTGAWATGTKAINSIPSVRSAPAGILSPSDLPLPHMLELT